MLSIYVTRMALISSMACLVLFEEGRPLQVIHVAITSDQSLGFKARLDDAFPRSTMYGWG